MNKEETGDRRKEIVDLTNELVEYEKQLSPFHGEEGAVFMSLIDETWI
ncbi:hypothetical protein B4119_4057 [Parageobacillus caldoxylosilyticus]|mgnify:CR=1 FL=1|uniref:Uncharacterized protein n=1 Tax=Saccharococcus caldoxylosilyticus TaxID=81408 RepID=A0A150M279_9BACL|nr:hypothetical protein B4119_4057 [Parageobacillus caldoxylosilyticus]